MSNVQQFTPMDERIQKLASAFCQHIEEENARERTAAFISGYCNAQYHTLTERLGPLSQSEQLFLIEAAFWRGVYKFLRQKARFAIADKVGFLLPKVEDIGGFH